MAVVKNLMVRAGADFSAITKQANQSNKAMQSMQQKFNSSCKGMQSAFNGLKSALGAMGVVLSLGAVVSASKEAYEAYTQQAEGETKLQHVMRRTMDASNDEVKSILDLCSAQQQLGIVGDEVQYAGAQELATYLEKSKSLKKLIPVMNDMVAQQYGYNATAENATNIATMLGKVMEGQTGALSRYGYYFTDAQAAVLKYGNEEQRAATLADVVSASVGGMNQALAMTPVGRMVQLKNTMSDVQESFGNAISTIGTVFLPVLQRVAGGLQTIANFANRVAQSIAEAFGGDVSTYDITPAVVSYGDALDDATESANETAKATKNLSTAAFDTITKLGGSSDTGSDSNSNSGTDTYGLSDYFSQASNASYTGTATQSFGALSGALENLKTALDTLRDNEVMQQLGTCFKNFVKDTATDVTIGGINGLAEAMQTLNSALSGDFGGAVGHLFNADKNISDAIFAPFTNAKEQFEEFINGLKIPEWLKKLWTGSAEFGWENALKGTGFAPLVYAKDAIDWLSTVDWSNLWPSIKAKFEDTKEQLSEKWTKLTSCITDKVADIKAKIATKWSDLKEKWEKLKANVSGKTADIKAKVATKWSDLKDKWEKLKANVSGKTADFKAKVATKWSDLKDKWDELMNKFKDKTVNISTKINAKVADLKEWINENVIDKINAKIQGVSIGGIKVFKNVAIPHLAQGGYLRANNPTLAVVGDNTTQGEIVAPEGKLAAMAREAALRVMSGASAVMRLAQVAPSMATVNRPGGIDRVGSYGDMDDVIQLMRKLLTAVEAGHVIELDKKRVGQTNRSEGSRIARANGYA